MTALYVFTYLTAVVFVIAIAARAIRIASAPMHLRWELYPVAHEGKRSAYGGSYLEDYEWWTKKRRQNRLGELTVMIPEILLLKGLWENNRGMWFPSFTLHHGIYWLAGTAFLMIVSALFNLPQLSVIITVTGTVGYIAGIVGAVSLLAMRLTSGKLKPYTSLAAYFNLLFLLAIFATGIYSAVTSATHYSQMTEFFGGLLGKGFVPLSGAVTVHILVAVLFVLYLPFTHMTHFIAKYFTYHSVKWNDEPNLKGGNLEKDIGNVLKYPVTWSAKHLGADGEKNWADIALSEVPDDEK